MSETRTLLVLYNIRNADGWETANRHRNYWGKTHTRVHYLEENVVVLAFRPAPDQRWRPWEAVRQSRILGEHRSIEMVGHIIAADYQGGWVDEHRLLEDGTVETIHYKGGSEEAERIQQEAMQRGPAS